MTQTRQTMTPQEVDAMNKELEDASPQEVLAWAMEQFGCSVSLSSSFGAEDVALIDMMWRIDPKARLFTLETLRLPTETYTLMDKIRLRYGIDVDVQYPEVHDVREMVEAEGFNPFHKSMENRKLCCDIRTVQPLRKHLAGLSAWITGLRRDQATTRANVAKVEIDEALDGIIKINPLADWKWEQVRDYIHETQVSPYNELHDNNFPSIGGLPCTRAVKPDEDQRAGRWWWETDPNAKECGLHIVHAASGPKLFRGKGSEN